MYLQCSLLPSIQKLYYSHLLLWVSSELRHGSYIGRHLLKYNHSGNMHSALKWTIDPLILNFNVLITAVIVRIHLVLSDRWQLFCKIWYVFRNYESILLDIYLSKILLSSFQSDLNCLEYLYSLSQVSYFLWGLFTWI